MSSKVFMSITALAVCVSLLCGCSDNESKTPFSLNENISSVSSLDVQSDVSNRTSNISQNIQSEPISSTSTDLPDTSMPQSTDPSSVSLGEFSSTDGMSDSSPITSSRSTSTTKSTPYSTQSRSTADSTSSISAPKPPSSTTTPASTPTTTPTSTSTSIPTPTPTPTPSSATSSTTSIPTPTPTPSLANIDDYTSKWAYNHINAKQQEIYKRLFNCAKELKSEFNTSDLSILTDDVNTAYWAFDYDNPQFLELGSGYSYSYIQSTGAVQTVIIEYSRTAAEIDHVKFNGVVKSVLAEAQSQPNDYEKLKYVHDWIINNTKYSKGDTDFESEADGPVVYGKAICEGYSKAFMYFAQSLGFPCVCVIGSAGGEGHMWNMVNIGGQWYNVDVTWDDPVMSNGSQMLRHNYFLISDTVLHRNHSVNNPFALPSAPQSYAQ